MASCKRPAGRPRIRPRASSSAVLLLGRKTYEIFAAYWSYYDEDASHGSIAKLFNDIKKYAVSRSGEVDTMKRLKQETARTSLPRAVPISSTRYSPMIWSTP